MAIPPSRKIFIDNSFFISFIDRADLNHQRSASIMDFLARQGFQTYTSDLTIFLTFSRLDREFGSAVSLDFLQAILESQIQILFLNQSELFGTFRFLKSNTLRQSSLTDYANAYLMDKQNISNILTYDPWYNLRGITLSNLLSS